MKASLSNVLWTHVLLLPQDTLKKQLLGARLALSLGTFHLPQGHRGVLGTVL